MTKHAENDEQKGILGIDAGGTFTDLVFWGEKDASVLASAKTPTLHDDLPLTIRKGLSLILEKAAPERIKAFNLATTLATNAIVENKLRDAALFLIGYGADIVAKLSQSGILKYDRISAVGGGHDAKGNEAEPFDEAAFREACRRTLGGVSSAAVSSYFSVRNPSHELRAREIIQEERPNVYVTCGHELATELDALKRATTAALNAGLIPIVIDLLNSVERACAGFGIKVPIMIVRSDGSLVSMEWAREHPIETLLSGPASSAIGARWLAGAEKFSRGSCVVDMGGTTTDIIFLDGRGRPTLGAAGTTVGGHKTLVKSIDIFTFGLGGDSRVRFDKDGALLIGPRRAMPLCSAAEVDARVMACLKEIQADGRQQEPLVVFKGESAEADGGFEERMAARLEEGPSTVGRLLKDERMANMCAVKLDEMERRGVINYAAFTPTDALAALGLLDRWEGAASHLGAEILSFGRGIDRERLCRDICEKVSLLAAENVFVKKFLSAGRYDGSAPDLRKVVAFALSDKEKTSARVDLKLNSEIIGVGAPSWAFITRVGEMLSEKAICPENAGVAGAVGAAVGTFYLRYAALITPMPDGLFRAHLPLGVKDFEDLESAVGEVVRTITPWIRERAKKAGALDPFVEYRREDVEAEITGGARKLHLATHIYFDVSESGCDG